MNTDVVVIPGRMTSQLLVLDGVVNKLLKRPPKAVAVV
jgi:hypothetical protein